MSSQNGVSDEKILALDEYMISEQFSDAEKVALEYADSITLSNRDVTDELFDKLCEFFDDDTIVELTAIIAWENCSSKFNRALRIESQGLWQRKRK